MGTIISASKARKRWFQLLQEASSPGQSVTITYEGHPPVLMMPLDEYEGWMETLEVMSDPDLVKAIEEGSRQKGGIELSQLKKKYKL